MTLQDFLARARMATATSTFYWLGNGGWTRDQGRPAVDAPATAFNIESALLQKQRDDPKVYEEYIANERASGISRASLPKLACDCSGYVCWALGVARDSRSASGAWFDTDGIFDDANDDRQWFVPLDRAVPGALLVHPRPSKKGGPGHVGIVTEVDAAGKATRMLHCSAFNYLQAPPPGLPRSAIAETDTSYFDGERRTQVVMWKAFV
jgi:CHAP domain